MRRSEPDGDSVAHASNRPGLSKLAEAGISDETIEQGFSLEKLDPHDHEALKGLDHWQDIRLMKSYAMSLLCLVAIHLFVADIVFIVYAWAGEHWQLDAGVVQF